MRPPKIALLVYGGGALLCAGFGIGWWVSYDDPVLGVFFLVLAALSASTYFLVTQPMRLRARRDARRPAPAGAPDASVPHGAEEILVERPRGYYYAAVRRYRIVVDGRRAGTVRRGETLRVPVAPGPHTVVARIDWTGSPEIRVEVPPGGRVHLEVEPGAYAVGGVFSTGKALRLTARP